MPVGSDAPVSCGPAEAQHRRGGIQAMAKKAAKGAKKKGGKKR